MLSAGTRLGPYEILSPLGEGGTGDVTGARYTHLDRGTAVEALPVTISKDFRALSTTEATQRADGLWGVRAGGEGALAEKGDSL